MTVKVTLEFASIDVAIVELGKLTKAAGTTIVDGKPRKTRGRPPAAAPADEPKAEAAAPTAPAGLVAAEDTTPTTASPVAPSASAAASASSATQAEAQAALEKLFAAFQPPEVGVAKAKDVLAEFGVARLRELPEGRRAEFIVAVDKHLASKK